MTRGETLLIGLLLLAMVLATALAGTLPAGNFKYDLIRAGFLIAQVVLASALLVFLPRMLWLRLLVLLATLLAYPSLVTGHFSITWEPLQPMSVALVATAWCACLRFFGWRISKFDAEPIPRRQFSLATVMLCTTIFAVYLGLLRIASSFEVEMAVAGIVLAIPGCAMLIATARHRFAWLVPFVVAGLFYGYWWAAYSTDLGGSIRTSFIMVLTAELVFLAATLIVLRIAGIHLTLPAGQANSELATPIVRSPVGG